MMRSFKAISSREATPDAEVKNARPAETLRVWNPANDVLQMNGMDGIEMAPGWEFSRAVRTESAPEKERRTSSRIMEQLHVW